MRGWGWTSIPHHESHIRPRTWRPVFGFTYLDASAAALPAHRASSWRTPRLLTFPAPNNQTRPGARGHIGQGQSMARAGHGHQSLSTYPSRRALRPPNHLPYDRPASVIGFYQGTFNRTRKLTQFTSPMAARLLRQSICCEKFSVGPQRLNHHFSPLDY